MQRSHVAKLSAIVSQKGIWEPGIYTNAADFNLDGQVNFEDFAYMADTWLWQTAWH